MDLQAEIRRVVADRLGVSPEVLVPELSLPDDLAADSLDLADLAAAFEAALGIAIPWRRLDRVRTYGDLVDAVATTCGERPPAWWARAVPPMLARHRLVPAAGGRGTTEHAGPLDPYTVEVLIEEARRAGPGARVEIEVDGDAEHDALVSARRRLGARGVAVSVRRDPSPLSRPMWPSRRARGSRR